MACLIMALYVIHMSVKCRAKKLVKVTYGSKVKNFVTTTSYRTAWPISFMFGLNESPWLIGVQRQGHFGLESISRSNSDVFQKVIKTFIFMLLKHTGCSISNTLFLQWPNFDLDLLKWLKLGYMGQTSTIITQKLPDVTSCNKTC